MANLLRRWRARHAATCTLAAIARSTAASAASARSASGPPAWAMSARPPPPLPPALLDEAGDPCRQLGRGRPQTRRGLTQNTLFLGEINLGRGTGQSLDPTHPGGDRRFCDDLEQSDITGATDMRAAAELD